MITEPIQITINNSYNLKNWEQKLILRCMYDNPSSSMYELSQMLGISDRNLFRKFEEYDLVQQYSPEKRKELFQELKIKYQIVKNKLTSS